MVTTDGDSHGGLSRRKKRSAVVAGGLVVVLGAGVAFAAYLSGAAGTGAATSSSAVDSVISVSSAGSALDPGASTPVAVGISNPNAYPVRVTSISGGASLAAAGGSCAAGTVTTAGVPNPPADVIPPNGSGTYTLVATMSADPDDSCQEQTFSLPLTAQLASAAS